MPQVVIENPVLNSPYEEPSRHFYFDEDGITDKVVASRRLSSYFIPIAKPKKKGKQLELDTEWTKDRIEENKFINDVRHIVSKWRLSNYDGVTSTTRQLLEYWRRPERDKRLYYCQIEAMETAIYLAEVADRQDGAWILRDLKLANQDTNPLLARIAFKMATGSGKTVVMAMLIAWQALNKLARPPGQPLFRFLPDRHARHHHPRSLARLAAERSGQLLPQARRCSGTSPRAADARQDHHHQLPRVPSPREGCRRQADQAGPRQWRYFSVHRDARRNGPPCLPRLRCQEERDRHQRRSPPLLPRQARTGAGETGRRRAQGS